jgi:hypothetical protein
MKSIWEYFRAELAGLLTSALFLMLVGSPLLLLIQKITKADPESLLAVMAIGVLPLALIAGNALTGYMIERITERGFIKYLLFAPGFYVGLIYFVFAALSNYTDPDLTLAMRRRNFEYTVIIALTAILFSYLGVIFGQKLKKRTDDH